MTHPCGDLHCDDERCAMTREQAERVWNGQNGYLEGYVTLEMAHWTLWGRTNEGIRRFGQVLAVIAYAAAYFEPGVRL